MSDRWGRALPSTIHECGTVENLAAVLAAMGETIRANMAILRTSLLRKDGNYKEVKDELVSQMVEKRKREEGKNICAIQFHLIFLIRHFIYCI